MSKNSAVMSLISVHFHTKGFEMSSKGMTEGDVVTEGERDTHRDRQIKEKGGGHVSHLICCYAEMELMRQLAAVSCIPQTRDSFLFFPPENILVEIRKSDSSNQRCNLATCLVKRLVYKATVTILP